MDKTIHKSTPLCVLHGTSDNRIQETVTLFFPATDYGDGDTTTWRLSGISPDRAAAKCFITDISLITKQISSVCCLLWRSWGITWVNRAPLPASASLPLWGPPESFGGTRYTRADKRHHGTRSRQPNVVFHLRFLLKKRLNLLFVCFCTFM